MAFYQNMNIPKQLIVPFSLSRFEGGLNNVGSPLEISVASSPNMLNVMCDNPGIIETRPGLFKYILTQLPEIVYRAFSYKTNTFTYLLLSSKTKLYKCNLADESITEICAINNIISGCQKGNKFYFVDGEKYREYDGTNIFEIVQPTIETYTAVSGSIGEVVLPEGANTNDDYYNNWWVYIKNGTGYGQKKQITDYVGSTKTATVAWTTAPDATSLLYLTKNEQGSTVYDNGTVIYTPSVFEFADDFKGVNNINTFNNMKHITYHKQRFWASLGTSKNLVVLTDLDNVYYAPNNLYFPPVTDDDDYIVGTRSFNNALLMIKKNSIFALYGTTYQDFSLRKLNVTTGAFNIDVVQQLDGNMYFLGNDGVIYKIYNIYGDNTENLVTVPISTNINIANNPINIDINNVQKAFAVIYKHYYILVIDDKMLKYNTLQHSWEVWDNWNPTLFLLYDNQLLMSNENKYLYRCTLDRFYVTETFEAEEGQTDFILQKGYLNEAYTEAEVKVDNIKLESNEYVKLNNNKFRIIAGTTEGQIVDIKYYSLQSYNDDGVAYNCYWHTKDLDYDNPMKKKKFRKIYLIAHTFKYFMTNLAYKVWIDYNELDTDIKINNQISLWGVAKFGDKFIKRNVVCSEPIQINNRGRIIRYIMSTECNDTPFCVYEINGEVEVI